MDYFSRKYTGGDSSKLQGDLNFSFDQRESEVNLHKATSSPESPSNVSPGIDKDWDAVSPRSSEIVGLIHGFYRSTLLLLVCVVLCL